MGENDYMLVKQTSNVYYLNDYDVSNDKVCIDFLCSSITLLEKIALWQ